MINYPLLISMASGVREQIADFSFYFAKVGLVTLK
jgi:hypothetical protein